MAKNLIRSPAIVYIQGEEMTRYVMQHFIDMCIKPHIDIKTWNVYDLSCKNRDRTKDQVLKDAILQGKKTCSIFKEPTVTPSAIQKKEHNLSMDLKSPNGLMRQEWNGFTISRDTIHIQGISLGYENPVFFERHAIGGEYGAGWKILGPGIVKTLHFEPNQLTPTVIDERTLTNETNAVVSYHNPLDNVEDLAFHFFSRCLEANIIPYVITKKTVFKWQEPFWKKMKDIFDTHYKDKYVSKGIINQQDELTHIISDAATMKMIQWKKGGFGMVAHNYDADMLTDEMAQIHRSPGFITSNLIGKSPSGKILKQFEASHGTVTDMWIQHLRGEETSLNPLGLIEALMGSLNYGEELENKSQDIRMFNTHLRNNIHRLFREGKGTRDICGPQGLKTEDFIYELSLCN
tara:strand:+ start:513 stop:1724 length:1212 start_codon:yes stop_codon:yes gene_type:complete